MDPPNSLLVSDRRGMLLSDRIKKRKKSEKNLQHSTCNTLYFSRKLTGLRGYTIRFLSEKNLFDPEITYDFS